VTTNEIKGYFNSEASINDGKYAPIAGTGNNYVTDTLLKSLIQSTGANSVIITATGGMFARLPAYGSWRTSDGYFVNMGDFKAILWDSSSNIPPNGIIFTGYPPANNWGYFKFVYPGLYQISFTLSVIPTASVSANVTTNIAIFNNSTRIESSGDMQANPKTTTSRTIYSLTSIIKITDINEDNISIRAFNVAKLMSGSLSIIWLGYI